MRTILVFALGFLAITGGGGKLTRQTEYRGCAFFALTDWSHFERREQSAPDAITLTSTELPLAQSADEIIVSWNAETPAGTGLQIEARAKLQNHWTRYYTFGTWSPDGKSLPRASKKAQKDPDGDVHTDTLALQRPADFLQIRMTLYRAGGVAPNLKFLGISLTDTHAMPPPLVSDHAVWGHEVSVPSRTQLGWPGASGWCSPTSTDMALAYWASRLHRPELDIPVPEAAHAIYDPVYDGTGNWIFNTAFAGAFPGMRAYVTRLSDITELEAWIGAEIPPVVSVSYDLLRGKATDNDPGHLMVCVGFTPNGDIVLNDPAHHPDRGETARRVFPRAHFLRAWARSRNTVYLIYPESASLPPDRFGHWK